MENLFNFKLFLLQLKKSDFIVSLFVCEQLFSLTLPLSIFLQEKSLDMASAINHAKSLLKSLEILRADAKDHFVKLFDLARTTSEKIFQSNLTIPRQSSRQVHRANPGTNSVEDYFRVAVFIPCVDSLIQNITERFMSNEDILTSFQVLLPGFSGLDKVHHMEQLSEYFENDAALASVKAEYIMWCNITPSIKKDTEVLKVLELCDKTYYRSINFLLTVLATLPVTTCSVERSFSTMKRVKSVSRSLMTDQRLSGLAMISIHRDITIKPEKVIDKMAGEKKRRLLL